MAGLGTGLKFLGKGTKSTLKGSKSLIGKGAKKAIKKSSKLKSFISKTKKGLKYVSKKAYSTGKGILGMAGGLIGGLAGGLMGGLGNLFGSSLSPKNQSQSTGQDENSNQIANQSSTISSNDSNQSKGGKSSTNPINDKIEDDYKSKIISTSSEIAELKGIKSSSIKSEATIDPIKESTDLVKYYQSKRGDNDEIKLLTKIVKLLENNVELQHEANLLSASSNKLELEKIYNRLQAKQKEHNDLKSELNKSTGANADAESKLDSTTSVIVVPTGSEGSINEVKQESKKNGLMTMAAIAAIAGLGKLVYDQWDYISNGFNGVLDAIGLSNSNDEKSNSTDGEGGSEDELTGPDYIDAGIDGAASILSIGGKAGAAKVGREIAEAGTKTLAEDATKIASKKATKKAIEKEVKKKTTEKVAEKITKVAGKKVASSIFKKIPLVGAVWGIGEGLYRGIAKGDWTGAALSVASGLASTVPGVGTAVSTAIDVVDAGREIYNSVDDAKRNEETKKLLAESKNYKSGVKGNLMNEIVRKYGDVSNDSRKANERNDMLARVDRLQTQLSTGAIDKATYYKQINEVIKPSGISYKTDDKGQLMMYGLKKYSPESTSQKMQELVDNNSLINTTEKVSQRIPNGQAIELPNNPFGKFKTALTSNYREKRPSNSRNGHGAEIHPGIDLRAEAGTPVQHPYDSMVVDTGKTSDGPYIVTKDSTGMSSIYWHVNPVVNPGDRVNKGQQIGIVASTAENNGSCDPHIHYELRKDYKNLRNKGITVNPLTTLFNLNTGDDKSGPVEDTYERANYVTKYLIDKHGYTPEQASGIAGVLIAESGINPKAVNTYEVRKYGIDKAGHGICQWSNDRNKDFQDWHERTYGSRVYASQAPLDHQLEFMLYEMSKRKAFNEYMSKATTPVDAADIMLRGFENGGINALATPSQIDNTYARYNNGYNKQIKTRGGYAVKVFENYTGGKYSGPIDPKLLDGASPSEFLNYESLSGVSPSSEFTVKKGDLAGLISKLGDIFDPNELIKAAFSTRSDRKNPYIMSSKTTSFNPNESNKPVEKEKPESTVKSSPNINAPTINAPTITGGTTVNNITNNTYVTRNDNKSAELK